LRGLYVAAVALGFDFLVADSDEEIKIRQIVNNIGRELSGAERALFDETFETGLMSEAWDMGEKRRSLVPPPSRFFKEPWGTPASLFDRVADLAEQGPFLDKFLKLKT
jgi:hypothetical protein